MTSEIVNINYGVMGHVDCGKTALCKCLTETPSTASFDKSPQSQERGITLDMGFSCFTSEIPSHIKQAGKKKLQITLVDCPGHASLIKTVIGASKIIDCILLVIDITHGVQLQTAECLILAEIIKRPLMIALNKVDLLLDEGEEKINKVILRLRKSLSNTPFATSIIVPVSCLADLLLSKKPLIKSYQPDILKQAIISNCSALERSAEGPLLFVVDHCFGVKGQGTILTGTAIQGKLEVDTDIEILGINTVRKVKSIQCFRKPTTKIIQGDRAGICVNQLDPKLIERGLVTSPGSPIKPSLGLIIHLKLVPFFKGDIFSKKMVDISVGFEIVRSKIILFGPNLDSDNFSLHSEFPYVENLNTSMLDIRSCYALLILEKPVVCVSSSLVIGIKLNTNHEDRKCRLMFHGNSVHHYLEGQVENLWENLKIYTNKTRNGTVLRALKDKVVLVTELFRPEVDSALYNNLHVTFSTGETGIIEGCFGQTGKIKINILSPEISTELSSYFELDGKSKRQNVESPNKITVTLNYKKYVNRKKLTKKFIQ